MSKASIFLNLFAFEPDVILTLVLSTRKNDRSSSIKCLMFSFLFTWHILGYLRTFPSCPNLMFLSVLGDVWD